jgi:hypothetical protein
MAKHASRQAYLPANHNYFMAACLALLLCFVASAQTDSTGLNRKRLNTLIIGGSAAYVGSMAGLYQLWYKDHPQSSFHFFNDNDEWMGLDKTGHALTAYWLGWTGHQALRWAGVEEKKAVWYGGCTGLIYQTTIEVFDGFSAGWGASPGDMLANVAGTGLFIGQQLAWQEQRILLRFSYHPTKYAQYRPDVLGKTKLESLLKDYNGHTYWLSGNIRSFLPESSRFPPWLNVAFGYGARGMLGGSENKTEYEGQPLPAYRRTSRWFMSLDIEPGRIPVRSRTLKKIFSALGFIKIPLPTLEYNAEDHFKFHILYF